MITNKVHIRSLSEGTLCQLCRGKFGLIVLVTCSQLTSLIKQLHSIFVTKSHEVFGYCRLTQRKSSDAMINVFNLLKLNTGQFLTPDKP